MAQSSLLGLSQAIRSAEANSVLSVDVLDMSNAAIWDERGWADAFLDFADAVDNCALIVLDMKIRYARDLRATSEFPFINTLFVHLRYPGDLLLWLELLTGEEDTPLYDRRHFRGMERFQLRELVLSFPKNNPRRPICNLISLATGRLIRELPDTVQRLGLDADQVVVNVADPTHAASLRDFLSSLYAFRIREISFGSSADEGVLSSTQHAFWMAMSGARLTELRIPLASKSSSLCTQLCETLRTLTQLEHLELVVETSSPSDSQRGAPSQEMAMSQLCNSLGLVLGALPLTTRKLSLIPVGQGTIQVGSRFVPYFYQNCFEVYDIDVSALCDSRTIAQLATLARLNKVGRSYLRSQPSRRKGVALLSAVSDSLDDVYSHLQENPSLCDIRRS